MAWGVRCSGWVYHMPLIRGEREIDRLLILSFLIPNKLKLNSWKARVREKWRMRRRWCSKTTRFCRLNFKLLLVAINWSPLLSFLLFFVLRFQFSTLPLSLSQSLSRQLQWRDCPCRHVPPVPMAVPSLTPVPLLPIAAPPTVPASVSGGTPMLLIPLAAPPQEETPFVKC